MAAVGFNGNITINSDIIDVDVGGAVTHAKHKSSNILLMLRNGGEEE